MSAASLHHVSLVVSDLNRAIAFYRDVLGFRQIDRPPLHSAGAWLNLGQAEIHLIVNTHGTFRSTDKIDSGDSHFALRVSDFDAMLSQIAAKGFREDAAGNDSKRLMVNRKSPVGYQQAYLVDPDYNIIEINAP